MERVGVALLKTFGPMRTCSCATAPMLLLLLSASTALGRGNLEYDGI